MLYYTLVLPSAYYDIKQYLEAYSVPLDIFPQKLVADEEIQTHVFSGAQSPKKGPPLANKSEI